MASESKRREVLQLLKDWRAFHTPFGGAIALEDSHLRNAAYGPAGYTEAGQEYSEGMRARLKHSYDLLEHAITLEKATPEGFTAWLLLHGPYFGDPGDPSIVTEWRELDDNRIRRHDAFVERLANHLARRNLYVVWPERMRRSEEKLVERRNDEFYAEYEQVKREKLNEGLSRSKANREAVEIAATRHGYGRSRAYDIVRVRKQGRQGNGGGEAA